MKHLSFSSCAVLLLSIAVGAAQQQPKKAVIEGVVSQVGTASPIPGARVTLARQARGATPATPAAPATGQPGPRGGPGAVAPAPPIPPVMTDEAGHFAFQDVDEGAYTIAVLANGYVGQNYGQRYAGGPGAPINAVAGQEVKDVAVSLTPAGTISGRIYDTADQPIINVLVQVFRYSYDATGQRSYQSAGSATTNDRGEYRIYWLTPGRYYLMAGRPSSSLNPLLFMATTMLNANSTNANVLPVPLNYAYYPGVSDMADARPIELLPGAEAGGMDLRLKERPSTFRVRGRLMDPRTGQPPNRATVVISPRTLDTAFANLPMDMLGDVPPIRNYNAATGTFEFRDLLPGLYTVMAIADEPQPAPGNLTGISTVVVSDEDIDGMIVTVIPSAAIPGQVRVDGQLPSPLTMERLRLQLTPANPSANGNGRRIIGGAAVVKADGSFRMEDVAPGDYRIRAIGLGARGAGASVAGIYIKEARFEGTDALNAPLHIAGSVSGSLDIVLGVGGGQVHGTLADGRLQPVPATQVTLIPTRNRDRTDLYKTVTTDENGRFIITNIVPGDYKVFSWEAVDPFGWFDPDLMAVSENAGYPVQITEVSSEGIEVRIIPAGGAR